MNYHLWQASPPLRQRGALGALSFRDALRDRRALLVCWGNSFPSSSSWQNWPNWLCDLSALFFDSKKKVKEGFHQAGFLPHGQCPGALFVLVPKHLTSPNGCLFAALVFIMFPRRGNLAGLPGRSPPPAIPVLAYLAIRADYRWERIVASGIPGRIRGGRISDYSGPSAFARERSLAWAEKAGRNFLSARSAH